MGFVELSDNEILGIYDIDEQHMNFAKVVSELYELLGQDKPRTVSYLFNQLVNEVKLHFQTEEKYMTENNYINFFSHKQEHDRFYKKVLELKEKLDQGKEKVTLETLKSFRNWLVNHIELNDKKLAEFLLENKLVLEK